MLLPLIQFNSFNSTNMVFVKLLLIFTLLYEIRAENCTFSDFMLHKRINIQEKVRTIGPINYVFDFEFIQEPKGNISVKLIKFLRKKEIYFNEPLYITEFLDREDAFEFIGHSNTGSLTSTLRDYVTKDVKFDLDSIKDEKCAYDVKSTAWQMKSEKSFTVIMLACHVSATGESFTVDKRVILISDEFNQNITNLTKQVKFQKEKFFFKNYYPQEFCLCDYLDSFYNECRKEEQKILFLIIFLISLFVAFIYILFEIYSCIIWRERVN